MLGWPARVPGASSLQRLARRGWLPTWLQGDVRALVSSDAQQGGLVVGLPRPEWDAVQRGFPDWDFVFARRSAAISDIATVLHQEGRSLIFAGVPSRRVIPLRGMTLDKGSWYLSRAPLPVIDGARGYLLETASSWPGGRRTTEMELLVRSGALEGCHLLMAATAALAERLRPRLDPDAPPLLLASDGRRGAVPGQIAQPMHAQLFDAHLHVPWWDTSVQEQLDRSLAASSGIIGDGHPVSARPALLGLPVQVNGRAFWRSEPFSTEGFPNGNMTAMLLASLLLSRYVAPDGSLSDPLAVEGR